MLKQKILFITWVTCVSLPILLILVFPETAAGIFISSAMGSNGPTWPVLLLLGAYIAGAIAFVEWERLRVGASTHKKRQPTIRVLLFTAFLLFIAIIASLLSSSL